MKRREAKFVHGSPRLSPDQIKAAPHVRETRPRSTGRSVPSKASRAEEARAVRAPKPSVTVIVGAEPRDVGQLPCPTCGGLLVCTGSPEVSISEADFRRRHAYWCSVGCRGPEPDGTFEFIECTACGSHDTLTTPRGEEVEELECHACGMITSLQMLPPVP